MPKFEYPTATLASMRQQYQRVEKFIAESTAHRKHDKKHPGRIDKLLAESEKYLQRAEWIMTGIPETEKDFNPPKIHLFYFHDALRLAHVFMVQAVTDQRTMLGEEKAAASAAGMAKVNAARRGTGDYVDELARRTHFDDILADQTDSLGDYIPARDLWPEFYSMLDEDERDPREVNGHDLENACIEYLDDDGSRKQIKYTSFRDKIKRKR